MASQHIDITEWFNNEAFYPDLTIGLSNGQIIRVHKAIVCTRNQFFERTGGTAGAAVKSKPAMNLSEPATAVTTILRFLYGSPLPAADSLKWAAWIDLALTARKYLEPAISEQALQNFMILALQETDVNEIVNMLDIVGRRGFDEVTNRLRRHHCPKLIPDKRYRQMLAGDTEMMWQHLDDLVVATESETLAIAE